MFCVITSLNFLRLYRNDKEKSNLFETNIVDFKRNTSQIIHFRFGISADVIIFSY
jgi:hypothetical protein